MVRTTNRPTLKKPINIAILISGTGTTMESIIKATKTGKLKGKVIVCCVIASTHAAKGIEKAKKYTIPVVVIKRSDFQKGKKGQIDFGNKLLIYLRKYKAHIITQNGWLPLTPLNVVEAYKGKLFNQHPGPLDPNNVDVSGNPLHFGGPGMYGKAVHRAVLEFNKRIKRPFKTEATIHYVSGIFDTGQVVFRREIEVKDDDTVETLSQRVLPIEHALFTNFLEQLYRKSINTLKRTSNLVKKGEENNFYNSLKIARKNYPNG